MSVAPLNVTPLLKTVYNSHYIYIYICEFVELLRAVLFGEYFYKRVGYVFVRFYTSEFRF